jgi:hypothetical protein
MIQEPLQDASGYFAIKIDHGDYHDRHAISIEIQSTMLHTIEL